MLSLCGSHTVDMNIPDYSLNYFVCDRCVSQVRHWDFTELPRPSCALAYIVSGRGEFVSMDRRDPVKPGDLVYTHIGSRYMQNWDAEPIEHISCRFNFAKPPAFFAGRRLYAQRLTGFEDTLPDFRYILSNQSDPDSLFSVLSRFYAILAAAAPKLEGEALPPADPLILRAVEYLDANAARPIRVEELAALCCLSESHFYTRFRSAVGLTPIEYKHRVMVRRAERLLLDSPALSVEEIGFRVGFESATYFRRVFRAVTGVSPGRYRAAANGAL